MRVIILGAGGRAKVVADIVRDAGHQLVGFVDIDDADVGKVAQPGGAKILYKFEGRCSIPAFVHPSATISPSESIGDGTVVIVGAGAVIIPGSTVGERASVGAGAAVVADVAASTTCIDVPGREINK